MKEKMDNGQLKMDNEIIFYTSPEGKKKVEVVFQDENFLLSQKRMAELFGVDVRTVNEHLKNIFQSRELTEEATIRKIRIVQKEGNREVGREVDFAASLQLAPLDTVSTAIRQRSLNGEWRIENE